MPFVAVGQGTPQAPVPPVPPLPTNPGQATGATGTTAPQAPAAQNPQAVRDQIRDQIRQGLRDGIETEAIITQEPPYRRNEDIPREVVPIIGIVFGSLVLMVLGYPIVRLFTRMAEKAQDKSLLRASDVTQQLKVLQNSIDTMAVEIERISESQRFQDRLLSEREPARLPESRGGA
jgi:hypothetical protein